MIKGEFLMEKIEKEQDSGVFCLVHISNYYGISVDEIQQSCVLNGNGKTYNDKDILRVAKELNLRTSVIKINAVSMCQFILPAVIRLKTGEYCVIEKADKKEVFICMANEQELRGLKIKELKKLWTGKVIFMIPRNSKPGIRWFKPIINKYKRPLIEVICAAILIPILTSYLPNNTQLIDEVPKNNTTYRIYDLLQSGSIVADIYWEWKESQPKVENRYCQLLAVDLDGKGIDTKDFVEGPYFDFDGDKFAAKTSWISNDEAFLAIDKDGDGIIISGQELFGDKTLLKNGEEASSGFEVLSEYDSNTDGRISKKDEMFCKMMLWQDKNGDGLSTKDEMYTLDKAGIKEISLETTIINERGSCVVLVSTADVIYNDETKTTIGEMDFLVVLDAVIYTEEVYIDEKIMNMPNVETKGNVKSLHISMMQDEKLVKLVEQLLQSKNTIDRQILVKKILYRVTDSEDIAINSRGYNLDARDLNVVGKFLGGKCDVAYMSRPGKSNKSILQEDVNKITYDYYCNFLNHIIPVEYLPMLYMNSEYINDEYFTNSSVFNECMSEKIEKGENVLDIISDVGRSLKDYHDQSSFEIYEKYYLDKYPELAYLFDYDISILMGTDKDDTINGTNGNDILYGGFGEDCLNGGTGDDAYSFHLNEGRDTILDYDSTYGNIDILQLGTGIETSNTYLQRDKTNLIIGVQDTQEQVIIYNYYLNSYYQIEKIAFQDGYSVTNEDISNLNLQDESRVYIREALLNK